MPHKFDPKNLDRLDRQDRRQLIDVEAVFSQLPLTTGQSVADIGCGTGFFAIPLSRHVPEGKVYALDIADEMLSRLRQKVAENGAANIEVLKCSEMDFPLPKGAMDGILLAFVLHEQEDRVRFLEKVHELLKPGAWVGIIEWEKKETKMGPPVAERIDRSEVKDAASKAGLDFLLATQSGETNYVAVLKRPDSRKERDTATEAVS